MPPARFALIIGAVLLAATTTLAIVWAVTSWWATPWAVSVVVLLILGMIARLMLGHRHG